MAVLAEVALADADTYMSSLTSSPGNCKLEQEQEHNIMKSLSKATMQQIDEGGIFSTQSMIIQNALENAVNDGVKCFVLASGPSTKSSTSSKS